MPDTPLFRAKGRGFTATLRYADKRVPGGLDAVRSRLSAGDRQYIGGLFLESGWYDALVLERLMRVVASAQGASLRNFAREQAVRTARRDLQGVYRHSFRAGSAGEMAARLPRGFNRYFEPTHAFLLGVEGSSASYLLRQVPRPLEDLCAGLTEGFCTGAMETAGVPPPLFSWDPPQPDEPVESTPTVSLPFQMLW